jgi:hypothetical protein
MSSAVVAVRSARASLTGLLLALALVGLAPEAAAQAYHPATLAGIDREREFDLQAFDAFRAKRPAAEDSRALKRPDAWTLYGRLGLMNFQNQLDSSGGATQFSWRRTGPALGGRIYVGIRRSF